MSQHVITLKKISLLLSYLKSVGVTPQSRRLPAQVAYKMSWELLSLCSWAKHLITGFFRIILSSFLLSIKSHKCTVLLGEFYYIILFRLCVWCYLEIQHPSSFVHCMTQCSGCMEEHEAFILLPIIIYQIFMNNIHAYWWWHEHSVLLSDSYFYHTVSIRKNTNPTLIQRNQYMIKYINRAKLK